MYNQVPEARTINKRKEIKSKSIVIAIVLLIAVGIC
jgi:hypothetical protein